MTWTLAEFGRAATDVRTQIGTQTSLVSAGFRQRSLGRTNTLLPATTCNKRTSANPPDKPGGQVVAGSNPVSPTVRRRSGAVSENLGSPVVGKKWLRTPNAYANQPSAWAFSRSASLPEHGADRAVPLGPHLDPLGPLLGQPHEQRHAGRHAVQFGVVLAAALELFA